jgi:DNA-binding response OmpR family regulator
MSRTIHQGNRPHDRPMMDSVLVVESHQDLRSVIASALARAHYGCDAVATGAAALVKLREGDYAYILVDVDSGTPVTALCDALIAQPALLAKVVVISDGDAPEGLAQQPLLQKPFDNQQLLARLTP